MRYAYGVSAALLLGGAAVTAITGLPAGAQVAQNASQQVEAIIPRQGAPVSFADLVQQLQPAVVNISTRQQVQVAPNPLAQMFGGAAPQTRESGALGTGFLISADGFVVTNNHVVTAGNTGVATSITVKLADGKEFNARLVGRDQQSDVAVLKIESSTPLPFVEFGDSDRARAGDWVVAIGNPFGLNGTVTAGIISAVQRNTGTGAFDHYIQSDASINSGNSGGPMFDMSGKVIGINNWIIPAGQAGGNIGLGFAIPANIARPIIDQLKSGAPIERGYLGVALVQIGDDLAASLGVQDGQGEFVQTVIPGKGADQAGIRPGDVVTKVGDKDVTPAQTATSLIFNLRPGTRVPIELLRNGRPVRVTATVGRRPTEDEMRQAQLSRDPGQQGGQQQGDQFKPGQSPIETALGLTVTPMTAEIANELGFPANVRGLVILGVDPSSDAAAKRLQRPFVILEAGGNAVGTRAELEAAIRAAQSANREALLLRVQPPGSQAGFVPVRLRSAATAQ